MQITAGEKGSLLPAVSVGTLQSRCTVYENQRYIKFSLKGILFFWYKSTQTNFKLLSHLCHTSVKYIKNYEKDFFV